MLSREHTAQTTNDRDRTASRLPLDELSRSSDLISNRGHRHCQRTAMGVDTATLIHKRG